MNDTKHEQEIADFTVLEEGMEVLHTNLTSVERRQVNNEVCTLMLHSILSSIKCVCMRGFSGKNSAC